MRAPGLNPRSLCVSVSLWFVAVSVAATMIATTATPVSAHHSLAAGFDINKTQTVTGVITSMEWKNPHGWLHIDVKDEKGQIQKYAIEFGAANSLYRRGWRQDDLPAGGSVTVTGYVARDGSRTLTGNEVKLGDGRTLFGGANPGSN
jgi:DNA/RNA endonuclease YhcR with UshA esterase domain